MSGVEAVNIIADWLDEVETSAGVEWPFPTDALAAHVVSVLAERGYSIVRLPELLPLGHEFRGIGHSCTKGLPGRRLCGESETAHLPTAAAAEEDTND